MGHPSPPDRAPGRDATSAGTARAPLDADEDHAIAGAPEAPAMLTPPSSAAPRWHSALPIGAGIGGCSIGWLFGQPMSATVLIAVLALSCHALVHALMRHEAHRLATVLGHQRRMKEIEAADRRSQRWHRRESVALAARVRHALRQSAHRRIDQLELVRLIAPSGGEIVGADGSTIRVRSPRAANSADTASRVLTMPTTLLRAGKRGPQG